MKVLVTQLCPALCDPMDCRPPGSSVHRISPGKSTGEGCRALLQRIFPTQTFLQGSNLTGILMKRGHLDTDRHTWKYRETWKTPPTCQGMSKAVRTQERDLEKILSHSPQREPTLP